MRCVPVLVILALSAACGGRTGPRAPEPLVVTRLGAADAFGRGIVSASPHDVRYWLARPAHVIVLRVERDGSIDPVFPARGDDATEQSVGQHFVEAQDSEPVSPGVRLLDPVLRSPEALLRAARPAPAPGAALVDSTNVYWLVVTSDVATSPNEVQGRLAALRRRFTSIAAELDALARALVAKRATTWAAYAARARPDQ